MVVLWLFVYWGQMVRHILVGWMGLRIGFVEIERMGSSMRAVIWRRIN